MVTRALACAQKKAAEEKATILWVDEAGFYLLPMAVRTWAPQGQTPILRVKLTRDHLSAIRDQGLSQAKGGETPAFGAITGVCT